MKMNFKLLFSICVTIICLLVLTKTEGYAGEARGVTKDALKIGVIMDQTGPAANVTVEITNAIRRYFRYANEHGGINGRKVEVKVEDDRYSVPMAIAAFKKLLYRDKILAMVGPSASTAALALLRHMEKEGIPTMPIPPQKRCVSPLNRYVFGVYEIYQNTMMALVDYMVKNLESKDTRIALVYPDNETGKLDLESAIERLKFHKLTPVTREVLNPGSIDATSQVMSMKRHNVNNIVLCGFIPQPAGLMLRELKKFGMNVPVFGNTAAADEEVMYMAGLAAEKYYSISPFAPWYDKGEGVAFMREVTLKYAPGTEKPYRGRLYTYGWAIATVLKEGLSRAGRDIDGERLVTAIETLKDFDTKGLCGPINFSATNHKGMNSAQISKADPASGKFVSITGWVKTD